MIVAAIAGVFISNPSCNLKLFNGFNVDGQYMFPILFVTNCLRSGVGIPLSGIPPVPRPSRLK